MPDVCLCLGPLVINQGFSKAMTVCGLRAIFFVLSQYLYVSRFDCFPVMIQEDSTRAKQSLCYDSRI